MASLSFEPSWEVRCLPPDRVYLLSGERRLLLRGVPYVSLLRGGRGPEELLALERLRARGLVGDFAAPPAAAPAAEYDWRGPGTLCPRCLRHRLRGMDPLRSLLDDLGATVVAPGTRRVPPGPHPVLPVPGCCAPGRSWGPPRLEPGRRWPASELLLRAAPLVSPVTGILADLRAAPLAPEGPWRANVRTCCDEPWAGLDRLPLRFPPGGLGRGETREAALASAVGEALETWAARWRGDEPVTVASRRELGAEAVPARDLWLYADDQADTGAGFYRHRVPRAVDDDEPIPWLPAWSLRTGARRWLPAFTVLMGPCAADDRFTYESNGLGAGACLEEAVLHALLEVVERDAVALWWYSRALRPGLPVDAPLFRRLGRSVWALDLTTDLGVPVAVAVSRSAEGALSFGMGAGLATGDALRRALLENAFNLDLHGEWAGTPDAEVLAAWSRERLEDHPWLAPHGTSPGPSPCGGLEDLLARLASRGLDALAVDLSRSDVPLAVARVIVPGMRHFTPSFAPGRLYDVPAGLGWVPRRLARQELNPVPFPG